MAKKKSTFWADFKAFAMKGNIIDMAVGVVVGGAFGKIVSSLVDDIIMPLVGWLIGGVDFTKLSVELKGTLASTAVEAVNDVAEVAGIEGVAETVDSIATTVPATSDIAIASVEEMAQQSVMLNYGNFIQQFVDFFIIALCIFIVLRAITRNQRKKAEAEAAAAAAAAAAPAPKPEDVALLEEIRDLLKNQK
ncbi:MAG: large conductance mechanosensitive channel protein MscL [Bacteroidales bacterium]|nr:large conductance mechanosensitive channel protein MscL [Bacteroidales bacterium]